MSKRILFLSNGHGEDLNASLVLKALRQLYPAVKVAALPIVGAGHAYRRLQVPLIGPTRELPSGGIFYMDSLALLRDLFSGLVGLTIQQLNALLLQARDFDMLFAAGDLVPIGLAQLTGRPYCAFIVSTSSYYEGKLRLPWLTSLCLRSSRCLKVFTRDAFTALDLQQQGLTKACFAGYPIMDVLQPGTKNLELDAATPLIALLPGSRLPEACHNLELQLAVCLAAAQLQPQLRFCAALVPALTPENLVEIAAKHRWQYSQESATGVLWQKTTHGMVQVHCYWDAFADILLQCHLAIGMAGTAVEQAVGLGKPVIQIPGYGPQFTYRFAEAQMRLLGESVQTIGLSPPDAAGIAAIADRLCQTLQQQDYLTRCARNGQERVGLPGGSRQIAQMVGELGQFPVP